MRGFGHNHLIGHALCLAYLKVVSLYMGCDYREDEARTEGILLGEDVPSILAQWDMRAV